MGITLEQWVTEMREAERGVEHCRRQVRTQVVAFVRSGAMSEREATRVTGLSRTTIRKWLKQTP